MNFSAVILAGGQSSRMGRDKAWLEVDGQSLLARQIELVRAVGAEEVFISGRAGVDYTAMNCPVVKDRFTEAGPLAGIEAALAASANPMLLVLAVDMPCMTAAMLSAIVRRGEGGMGVVPRVSGAVEPLAAIYPQSALPLASRLLAQGGSSVPGARDLAEHCVTASLARYFDLLEECSGCFANWNGPKDVPKA